MLCFNGELELVCLLEGEFGLIELVPDQDRPTYTGEYEIVPMAFHDQVINTSGKVLTNDITVFKIPFFVTSNESGSTAIIGE